MSEYTRFWIPIRTISLNNEREHWHRRAKRTRAEREAAYILTPRVTRVPTTVLLVRESPRKLDSDNLCGALKAIRDGIADRLGVDDGDPRIKWEYGQEKAKVCAVRVECF